MYIFYIYTYKKKKGIFWRTYTVHYNVIMLVCRWVYTEINQQIQRTS